MERPDVGTVWTRHGNHYAVIAPVRVETKDAQDGNWQKAVAIKPCGPSGRVKPGVAMRVLTLRDFFAQYHPA